METTGNKLTSSTEYAKRLEDRNIQKSYFGGSLEGTAVAKLHEALCFFADPQEHSLVLEFSCIKAQGVVLIIIQHSGIM